MPTVAAILRYARWLDELEPDFLVTIIASKLAKITGIETYSIRWRGLSKFSD